MTKARAEIRTHHIPGNERMRHSRGLGSVIKLNFIIWPLVSLRDVVNPLQCGKKDDYALCNKRHIFLIKSLLNILYLS